jgi:hypothetical protein
MLRYVKSGDSKNDEKSDENTDDKNEVRKIWGWKMFQDVSM